jgi:uncharacterized protein (DUF697 family)
MSLTKRVGQSLAPKVTQLAPQISSGFVHQALERAIHGAGPLDSAAMVAEKHLDQEHGDVDKAIRSIIEVHVRLAGAQGFLTNIGGLVTMPVMVPTNIAGLAMMQCRMVAAIAHLRGYDLDDPRVRTAVITCLLGEDGVTDRLKKESLVTSPLAIATAPVFDPELDRQVAGEVVGELIARISGKRMALTVTRRVPFLGGAVGAGVDGWSTYRIGQYADKSLVRRIPRSLEQ